MQRILHHTSSEESSRIKSQKMFHNFWPDFLLLFTKPINIFGVPEIGYWEIFSGEFQVK